MAHDDTAQLATDLRVAVGKVTRRLREQTPGSDLTHSQLAVVSLLESGGPATSTELAKARGMTPQSMGTIVAVLLDSGYVEKSSDPRDGRKSVLSLSDEARRQIASGRLAKEDFLAHLIETTFDAGDRRRLADAIALLRRVAEAP
ncbi:hypothetical protein GCM10025867_44180 [Frondihabitans sucicola]|uniref:HTH marR-type domain-containing protein n=1 Tax=Frondihabitans sucicola TaxID=1268041 RepID=A0ABM8GV05_9MICO|nr:MarR family transcriptional regulator [Frondihabitans sucicola]BDZ52177.1 hypothetical protein GCM10025867_44180 [Frondihabitans sucicola]